VSQWADKSGNGRNVTQGTAAAQPTTAAATLNGLNVLMFDGGDNLLAATASDWTFLHDGSVSTVWVVVRAGNVANPAVIYGIATTQTAVGGAAIGLSLYYADAFENDAAVVTVANGSASCIYNPSTYGALPANTWKRVRATTDADATPAAARSSISVNNGSAMSNNTQTAAVSALAPSTALAIGGTNNRLVGSIAEVIIINGTVTAQQITDTETYLATKWGL